jgi:hypothetical protein
MFTEPALGTALSWRFMQVLDHPLAILNQHITAYSCGPIQMQSASPTPLEQRQWRKDSQRSVRLALLGVRDARKMFIESSSAGYKEATELGNNLLLQQYLRNMQMGVLRGVPNIRGAAAEKLAIQQRRASEQLHAALRTLDGSVQSLRASLKDITAKYHASSSWQQQLPVFSTLTIGQILSILQDVQRMYDAELEVKKSLVRGLDDAVMRTIMGKQEEMKPMITMYLTTWVSSPKLNEDLVEQRLGVLAEDMAGF